MGAHGEFERDLVGEEGRGLVSLERVGVSDHEVALGVFLEFSESLVADPLLSVGGVDEEDPMEGTVSLEIGHLIGDLFCLVEHQVVGIVERGLFHLVQGG